MNNYSLAEQNLHLVSRQRESLLRKNWNNYRLQSNDLTDVGYAALLDSCEHYDESMGIPFEHYAARTIRRAMIKHIHEIAPNNITTIDEAISLDRSCCDWSSENEYLKELLKEAMNSLSPEERQLVESRFGFDKKPLKLRELGAERNISLQAVDKQLKRIYAKLYQYFEENRYTYSHCA